MSRNQRPRRSWRAPSILTGVLLLSTALAGPFASGAGAAVAGPDLTVTLTAPASVVGNVPVTASQHGRSTIDDAPEAG